MMIRSMCTKGSDIAQQLASVLDRMNAAANRRPAHLQKCKPRLVAVSKTKPASAILDAYACGQHHFGENYVQELEEKGHDPKIVAQCSELKWHFIGHLQKNKVNKVTGVPGLFMVETVDSQKIASSLNTSWGKHQRDPLKVMIQVNSSGEENKSGVQPLQAIELAQFICEKCPHLQLAGLMTIGAVENSSIHEGINRDFQCLIDCRKEVAKALNLDEWELELSMGMSQDFEKAVEAGSTNIRVGSIIFGDRSYPPKPQDTQLTTSSDLNNKTEPVNLTSSPETNVDSNLN